MQDRFKFRYVFKKDFGGKTSTCYKMPIFNLDAVTDKNFNKVIEGYTDYGYILVSINLCTGLKDKNGELIYEGDILNIEPNSRLKVIWDNKYVRFLLASLEHKYFVTTYNLVSLKNTFEIIGNIYENPELLNGGVYSYGIES